MQYLSVNCLFANTAYINVDVEGEGGAVYRHANSKVKVCLIVLMYLRVWFSFTCNLMKRWKASLSSFNLDQKLSRHIQSCSSLPIYSLLLLLFTKRVKRFMGYLLINT